MESVRKCAKKLCEFICKYVQHSVKAVRTGTGYLWEKISKCAKKLCEFICKCVQYGVNAVRTGTKYLWEKISKCVQYSVNAVRTGTEYLWEKISKCVQYSVNTVRTGTENLWEMISNFFEKLCELICKFATESVQALSQEIQKLIHAVDEAYCRVKAFYKNLSESLKVFMNQAKINTYECWKFASQMGSNWESSSGSSPDILKLLSSLTEYFKNVIGKENEHVSVLIKNLINALCMVSTILGIGCGNDYLCKQIKKLESLCKAPTKDIADIAEVFVDIICTIGNY